MVANGKNGKKDFGMLSVLNTINSRIRRQRVRLGLTRRHRRERVAAKISERIEELDQIEGELKQLIKNREPHPDDRTLVRLFRAEIEDAKRHYGSRNYRIAKKCRGSAKATLICIERNIRARALYGDANPTIN